MPSISEFRDLETMPGYEYLEDMFQLGLPVLFPLDQDKYLLEKEKLPHLHYYLNWRIHHIWQ